MIRPEDIFNAHRVVGSPTSYRRKAPGMPGIVLPDLGDPQRRATLARVLSRQARSAAAPATALARQAGKLRLR